VRLEFVSSLSFVQINHKLYNMVVRSSRSFVFPFYATDCLYSPKGYFTRLAAKS